MNILLTISINITIIIKITTILLLITILMNILVTISMNIVIILLLITIVHVITDFHSNYCIVTNLILTGLLALFADASPVQQQVAEIYNRYSMLGSKLTDRQMELDSMREECRKHSESLRILAAFLDKIERAMPHDSAVPQTRDDAEKQLRGVKNILEDVYDKQTDLDALKNQVNEKPFFLPYQKSFFFF